MNYRKAISSIGIVGMAAAFGIVIALLVLVLWDILSKGAPAISWEFLTQSPRKGMKEGGIFPALIGTVLVTMVTAIFAIPLGISAAIYLNEYALDNWVTRMIRTAIRNLAGVPSIVYGLFGVALFVKAASLGASILSSGMTLALLTLPWIVTTTEEALKAVPNEFREGAVALGATKWETIRSIVLPSAIPGIITGSILGLSRAAGETAPILFTGVAFFLPRIPASVFGEFMALPYHLYIMSTQHHAIEEVRPLAYGTALVLVLFVMLLNSIAFVIRYRYRKKLSFK